MDEKEYIKEIDPINTYYLFLMDSLDHNNYHCFSTAFTIAHLLQKIYYINPNNFYFFTSDINSIESLRSSTRVDFEFTEGESYFFKIDDFLDQIFCYPFYPYQIPSNDDSMIIIFILGNKNIYQISSDLDFYTLIHNLKFVPSKEILIINSCINENNFFVQMKNFFDCNKLHKYFEFTREDFMLISIISSLKEPTFTFSYLQEHSFFKNHSKFNYNIKTFLNLFSSDKQQFVDYNDTTPITPENLFDKSLSLFFSNENKTSIDLNVPIIHSIQDSEFYCNYLKQINVQTFKDLYVISSLIDSLSKYDDFPISIFMKLFDSNVLGRIKEPIELLSSFPCFKISKYSNRIPFLFINKMISFLDVQNNIKIRPKFVPKQEHILSCGTSFTSFFIDHCIIKSNPILDCLPNDKSLVFTFRSNFTKNKIIGYKFPKTSFKINHKFEGLFKFNNDDINITERHQMPIQVQEIFLDLICQINVLLMQYNIQTFDSESIDSFLASPNNNYTIEDLKLVIQIYDYINKIFPIISISPFPESIPIFATFFHSLESPDKAKFVAKLFSIATNYIHQFKYQNMLISTQINFLKPK